MVAGPTDHIPGGKVEPVQADSPIACSLGQDDLAERQRRWQVLADRASVDVTSTDYGLRVRFRGEPEIEAELRDFAALERDCCSFADWTVHSDGDASVMDIRGNSAESVAAIQQMFAGLRRSAAASDR